MASRERQLHKALERLCNALWDAELKPEIELDSRINKAYIVARSLLNSIAIERQLQKAK